MISNQLFRKVYNWRRDKWNFAILSQTKFGNVNRLH